MKRKKEVLFLIVAALLLVVFNVALASPIIYEDTKLFPDDGALDDWFGYSVDMDGDTLVVGALFGDSTDSGAVYVYVRDGNAWSQQAKLMADDAEPYDYFGWSVAIAGDTILVGANRESTQALMSGAVYVFTRSGTTWTQEAKLMAEVAGAGNLYWFGYSVDIDGDTAIVGAKTVDNRGAVHVFTRSGTTWSERATLTASDSDYGDWFGYHVTLDANTIIAGASTDDDDGADSGSVYVFTGSGATWTERAKLTADDATTNQYFGTDVDLEGDTAVIGAPGDSNGRGAVYVFTGSDATWTQQTKLVASDGAAQDGFGGSLDLDGTGLLVGAFGDDSERGSAYLFNESGAGWNEQAKLVASDGGVFDRLGVSVALNGNTAAAGAIEAPELGFDRSAAYLFSSGPSNQPPVASAGGPYDGYEGANIAINSAASSDPDGDALSYSWSVDSALCTFSDSTLLQPEVSCADNGVFTLTLTVSDGLETVASSTTLTVFNVAPTVLTVDVPVDPVDINEQGLYVIDVTFSDPAGSYDEPYSCAFDLSYDGTLFTPDVTVNGVTSGSCSAGFNYSEPDVYTVMVQVTDKDGGVGEAVAGVYIVVYNPEGGFVTGGGWIWSEPGACLVVAFCDPTASGKGHFGFVSKYEKGASVPTGNTNFKFTDGSLEFSSDSYDWLVVNQNNSNAQYKGSGFVNDSATPTGELFRFMIWAKDLDPGGADTFRIRIWYEDIDGIEIDIYDNGFDQPIDHGNIKIHTG